MLATLGADFYIYLSNMLNQPNISVKILFNVALKFMCHINVVFMTRHVASSVM